MTIAEWLAVLLLIALVCTVAYEMIFSRVNSNQDGEEGEEFEYMNVRLMPVSLCVRHCAYLQVFLYDCVVAYVSIYIYVYYGYNKQGNKQRGNKNDNKATKQKIKTGT